MGGVNSNEDEMIFYLYPVCSEDVFGTDRTKHF